MRASPFFEKEEEPPDSNLTVALFLSAGKMCCPRPGNNFYDALNLAVIAFYIAGRLLGTGIAIATFVMPTWFDFNLLVYFGWWVVVVFFVGELLLLATRMNKARFKFLSLPERRDQPPLRDWVHSFLTTSAEFDTLFQAVFTIGTQILFGIFALFGLTVAAMQADVDPLDDRRASVSAEHRSAWKALWSTTFLLIAFSDIFASLFEASKIGGAVGVRTSAWRFLITGVIGSVLAVSFALRANTCCAGGT